MPNTNAQTIHQMGQAINSVVRQATGRAAVENIDMDFVTVAQKKSIRAITPTPGDMTSFFVPSPVVLAKLKAQITPKQTGSGDPSPENVRPIIGVNPLVVNITGANQWDEEWEVSGSYIKSKNLIPCLPNTAYCFTAPNNPSNGLKYYDSNGQQVGATRYSGGVFTTPENASYISFAMASAYGTTYNHNISINYPATDTEYHAYTGRTQSISFSPTPGTVYGGELEVDENGDGVLTVNFVGVDLGDLQWQKYASQAIGEYFYTDAQNLNIKMEGTFSTTLYSMLCSKYKTTIRTADAFIDECITPDGNNTAVTQIQIKDSDYSTPEEFKASLSGCILVYQLATPETYQISTTPVTTISGENNIFTSAGDIEVTYYEYGEVI